MKQSIFLFVSIVDNTGLYFFLSKKYTFFLSWYKKEQKNQASSMRTLFKIELSANELAFGRFFFYKQYLIEHYARAIRSNWRRCIAPI